MRRTLLRKFRSGFCIVFLCLVPLLKSNGQEIKVSGGFLKDSIRIGESVGYYLSASYPQSLTVLFPDSTFIFAPFEFEAKKYFPTHTSHGISRDSAVYYLSTFEIDKVQHLSLPVYVVSARDCTAYEAIPDSMFLVELVAARLDSVSAQDLPLKPNTLYEKVFTDFNYALVMIGIGVLVVAIIIVWVVFGKKIIRYFKIKRLTKVHLKFTSAFSNQFHQLSTVFSREKAEIAVSLWKKYLEQLEQKPYTKLTTRETIELERNERLGNSLKMIDRAIYGNQTSVNEPLAELRKFAEERFQKKLEQVKHG